MRTITAIVFALSATGFGARAQLMPPDPLCQGSIDLAQQALDLVKKACHGTQPPPISGGPPGETPPVVSTSVACNPSVSFTAPLAAGTTVCQIMVEPAEWSGGFDLKGNNADRFAVSANHLIVGGTALAAGDYAVKIITTP